jgi:large subunit ribosomal protein L25
MKSVPLTAYPRTLTRRPGAKKLRASGRVPAIIYARAKEPQILEVDRRSLQDLIHHSASENLLLDLTVDGDARPQRMALVQEVQHHPLNGSLVHVDFHEVSANERVTVMVPVEPIGEAAGVKTGGGVLEHVLFKVKVRCYPKDLPEALLVDVTKLEIGQSIHIGEITPPEGVEILGDKKIPVLSVAAPVTEAEEAAATEAGAASASDVEMIKEKKEEGAPGAAAPAAKGGEKEKEKEKDKGAEKAPAAAEKKK